MSCSSPLRLKAQGKGYDKWKSGFYHAALGANVPVLPGYLDFKRKEGGFGPPIYLTGNKAEDMAQFKAFYADKTGKYPDTVQPQCHPARLNQYAVHL